MKKHKYSFLKNERIKSNKEISRIFNNGIFLFTKNISLVYLCSKDTDQKINQIAVSVPKKKFKSAVKRNKIKRQIKEAYRLNKSIIYDYSDKNSIWFKMIFIYKSKSIPTYKTIDSEVIELLKKMRDRH